VHCINYCTILYLEKLPTLAKTPFGFKNAGVFAFIAFFRRAVVFVVVVAIVDVVYPNVIEISTALPLHTVYPHKPTVLRLVRISAPKKKRN